MLGIHAALDAQRGYTAEEHILETQRGGCAVYGDSDGEGVTRGLGNSWDIITDMAIKLVPGGHPSHSLAEASANAARAGQVEPDNVETITLSRPVVTELTGPIHPSSSIGEFTYIKPQYQNVVDALQYDEDGAKQVTEKSIRSSMYDNHMTFQRRGIYE